MAHRAFINAEPAGIGDRARSAAPAVAVALVVAAAGWLLLRPSGAPVEATLPVASSAGAEPSAPGGPAAPDTGTAVPVADTTTSAPVELVVQAAGAVQRPGVYRLAPGSRIVDLVESAGGLSPTADRQRINLAAPVLDGERVWLPERGERSAPEVIAGANVPVASAPTVGGSAPGGEGGSVPTVATPLDLNTADAAALDALPGVGPATAAAILAQRQTMGGFRSVEDLLEVRGIGDAKLEQLRPLVRV